MTRFTIDAAGNMRERPQTPIEQRDFLLYYARVLLREAAAIDESKYPISAAFNPILGNRRIFFAAACVDVLTARQTSPA